jgi:micrococcal nuclease
VSIDPAYRYAATVTAVHDGDTITADVDLGFGVWLRGQAFRLRGLNARELAEPGGIEARDNLAGLLLPPASPGVTLTSVKPDKYGGRYDAWVTLPNGDDLATVLISVGWAAAWDGKGVKPVPAWPRVLPAPLVPSRSVLRREAVAFAVSDPQYRVLDATGQYRYYLDDKEITEAEYERLRAEMLSGYATLVWRNPPTPVPKESP